MNGGASLQEDGPYCSYSLYPPILPLVFINADVNARRRNIVGAPMISAAPKIYPIRNSGIEWLPKNSWLFNRKSIMTLDGIKGLGRNN